MKNLKFAIKNGYIRRGWYWKGVFRQTSKNIRKQARRLVNLTKRFFSKKKFYVVWMAEGTTSSYEDPKCPSYWRGSGCYDITIYNWNYKNIVLVARTEEEAEELALKAANKPENWMNYQCYGKEILDENTIGDIRDFKNGEIIDEEHICEAEEWTKDDENTDLESIKAAFN